jgi:hypothetical protein
MLHKICFLSVLRLLVFAGSAFYLTGCQGTLPWSDPESALFTPQDSAMRIMAAPRIHWMVREDVALYCARLTGMSAERANFMAPLGCATWDIHRQECTVVTGTPTSHAVLGHEVRHCFEGRFH